MAANKKSRFFDKGNFIKVEEARAKIEQKIQLFDDKLITLGIEILQLDIRMLELKLSMSQEISDCITDDSEYLLDLKKNMPVLREMYNRFFDLSEPSYSNKNLKKIVNLKLHEVEQLLLEFDKRFYPEQKEEPKNISNKTSISKDISASLQSFILSQLIRVEKFIASLKQCLSSIQEKSKCSESIIANCKEVISFEAQLASELKSMLVSGLSDQVSCQLSKKS